jgi:hypothetical protein
MPTFRIEVRPRRVMGFMPEQQLQLEVHFPVELEARLGVKGAIAHVSSGEKRAEVHLKYAPQLSAAGVAYRGLSETRFTAHELNAGKVHLGLESRASHMPLLINNDFELGGPSTAYLELPDPPSARQESPEPATQTQKA